MEQDRIAAGQTGWVPPLLWEPAPRADRGATEAVPGTAAASPAAGAGTVMAGAAAMKPAMPAASAVMEPGAVPQVIEPLAPAPYAAADPYGEGLYEQPASAGWDRFALPPAAAPEVPVIGIPPAPALPRAYAAFAAEGAYARGKTNVCAIISLLLAITAYPSQFATFPGAPLVALPLVLLAAGIALGAVGMRKALACECDMKGLAIGALAANISLLALGIIAVSTFILLALAYAADPIVMPLGGGSLYENLMM